MNRTFFAVATAWGVGVLMLAIGTSALVLAMGDGLSYSVRRAYFISAFIMSFWVAGIVAGVVSFLFWLLIAWPFHRRLLKVPWIQRSLLLIGVAVGGAFGFASSAMIGFWGGLPYTALLTLSGVASGFTFSYFLEKTK